MRHVEEVVFAVEIGDAEALRPAALVVIAEQQPSLHLPAITASRIVELIGPAFAIAMLGAIESLLSAVVADGMAGTRHDSNQELVGQGIANMAAPLFGGFAATGGLAFGPGNTLFMQYGLFASDYALYTVNQGTGAASLGAVRRLVLQLHPDGLMV